MTRDPESLPPPVLAAEHWAAEMSPAPVPYAAEPEAMPVASATPVAAAQGASHGQGTGATLQHAVEQWDLIRKICKQKSATTAALLSDAFPVAVEAGTPIVIVIAAKYPFHMDKLAQPLHRPHVEFALQQVLDVPCQVRFILEKDAGPGSTNGTQTTATGTNTSAPPSASSTAPLASAGAMATPASASYAPASHMPATSLPAGRDKQALIDAAMRDPVIAKLMQDHQMRIVDAGPLKDFFPGR
ncbi:MAG: hypothetical protein H0X24_09385 [Ktedonobacterales bacterium]|nr:hypothetical protein [Ktedonobacterales bacterium]